MAFIFMTAIMLIRDATEIWQMYGGEIYVGQD